jgi:sec-independent protein translocase protein TatA
MGELSPWHWLVVIAVAVLLFGAKRLPDAARSVGRSARILRAELGTQGTATEPVGPAAAGPVATEPDRPAGTTEPTSP